MAVPARRRRRGRAFIGTSGWSYKHWRGPFYPADLPTKRHFEFYRRSFDTVELNNPFYHLPQVSAVTAWRENTPPDFVFAVKASRFITHNKKLADPKQHLRIFFERMDLLGDKMGIVLFQLPPRWGFNAERLDAFLDAFAQRRRCVFEFRNPSWYAPDAYRILERHRAGFCIYDLAGHTSPLQVTADYVYIRLHGPDGKYAGSYDDHVLMVWAERIRGWLAAGKDVYCYFDNDIGAYAPRNALTLKRLIRDDQMPVVG
jgi:uncharacterized protein YecE (DUF72 family)